MWLANWQKDITHTKPLRPQPAQPGAANACYATPFVAMPQLLACKVVGLAWLHRECCLIYRRWLRFQVSLSQTTAGRKVPSF